MDAVTIGVDIGQKRDPTAIAVVEGELRSIAGRTERYHIVRHLARLPLGTPYPDVAARVAAVVGGVYDRPTRTAPVTQTISVDPRTGAGRVHRAPILPSVRLYADATGVCQPVVDLLEDAGIRAVAVYFTHGDRRVVQADGAILLGKAWLVSKLQALLQTGRLLLPKAAEAEVLAQELLDYEIRVDQDANDKYGAFKVGAHDDLVTAVGLAVHDDGGRPFSAAVGGSRPILEATADRPLLPWRLWG